MRARHFILGLIAALALCLPPAAEALPGVNGARIRAPEAGGDPTSTLISALLAASAHNALYVAGTDLATSKTDRSGNGFTLTAPGSEPTYGATSGPNSMPGLTFAGANKLNNTSFTDVNGTRIGMYGCGVWDTTGDAAFGLGAAFSTHPAFGINGSSRMEGTAIFATGAFQQASTTAVTDGSPHCWALWMRAASNDAELDGVAFGTDFTGNGVLDEGTISVIRMGGGAFSDGTGVLSVFGVITNPDSTKISAIESALAAYLGVTFS